MKRFIILFLAFNAAFATYHINAQWAEFKALHKKQYRNSLEEIQRMAIFKNNLAKIQKHNEKFARGEVTYSKKINHFADLTAEEFLEYVNKGKANIPKKNETYRLKWTPSSKPAYAAVDWRGRAVTEVKNQGDCGSCWSFSTTGAIEGQLALSGKGLISLSEQNLVDCSTAYGNAGCQGGWMDSAFDYIRDNGVMTESAYPYEAIDNYCRFDPSQSVTSLNGYYDLPPGDEMSLANAVSNNGPVAIAVDATDELQFYSGGIIYDSNCDDESLNHGVLVVGYGSEGGNDYWIIKNSWGSGWGEGGYYRAIRNYGNNCGIATAPSYPSL